MIIKLLKIKYYFQQIILMFPIKYFNRNEIKFIDRYNLR
jgi:hypothetical protein